MIRTQISFDAELYKKARQVARRRRISLAELCRRGLRAILASEPAGPAGQEYLDFLGSMATGDPNASSTVDDVVYGREEP